MPPGWNMSDYDKGRTKREVAELPSVLWEDELPEMAVAGTYHMQNGMLVATDRRMLFATKTGYWALDVDKEKFYSPSQRKIYLAEGIFSIKVEDFGYDRISSVESKTGMMWGEIKVYTAGNSETFKNIGKEEVRAFADFIRYKTNKAPDPSPGLPAPGGVATADELMKFAELLEKGIITQAEFDAQKARLLGS